jgi:hypothetical protein
MVFLLLSLFMSVFASILTSISRKHLGSFLQPLCTICSDACVLFSLLWYIYFIHCVCIWPLPSRDLYLSALKNFLDYYYQIIPSYNFVFAPILKRLYMRFISCINNFTFLFVFLLYSDIWFYFLGYFLNFIFQSFC